MSDEKKELLKKALLEARLKEFENIPAEDELTEEHVFSQEFEEKIKAIQKPAKKRFNIKMAGSFAAGFVIMFALSGSALFIMQNTMNSKDSSYSMDDNMAAIMEDADCDMDYDSYEGDAGVMDNWGFDDSIEMDDMVSEEVNQADIDSRVYSQAGRTYIEVSFSEVNDISTDIEFIFYDESLDMSELLSKYSPEGSNNELYVLEKEESRVVYEIDSELALLISTIIITVEDENMYRKIIYNSCGDGTFEID